MWLVFSLILSNFIYPIGIDYLHIARDILVLDFIPEFLNSTETFQFIPTILDLIKLNSSQDKNNEYENLHGCLIDIIFLTHSFYSITSIPLSPLQQRCIEIESVESDTLIENSSKSKSNLSFRDLLSQIQQTIQDQSILNYFAFVTLKNNSKSKNNNSSSIIQKYPSLCIPLIDNIHIWGSLFNNLQLNVINILLFFLLFSFFLLLFFF